MSAWPISIMHEPLGASPPSLYLLSKLALREFDETKTYRELTLSTIENFPITFTLNDSYRNISF